MKTKLVISEAILSIGAVLILVSNISLAPFTAHAVDETAVKGSLFNVQNDESGNPAWLVGGVFRMDNINSTSPVLNATFYMTKTDGTAPHGHSISNFTLTGKPIVDGNSTTFNGTSTVSMKDGPVNKVPTSIKLMDDTALSIWLDPSKTNSHFGNTVIYGIQHLICVERPQYCK